MGDFDHFERLRPACIEYCDCLRIDRLILVDTLNDNPIHCFECKGAVDPESLGLRDEETYRVHRWHRLFRALYDLWLDSAEYEPWAKSKLLAPDGRVNVAGIAAARALSTVAPTYYWWFHDAEDPLDEHCPVCGQRLVPAERHGERQCDACRVVI